MALPDDPQAQLSVPELSGHAGGTRCPGLAMAKLAEQGVTRQLSLYTDEDGVHLLGVAIVSSYVSEAVETPRTRGSGKDISRGSVERTGRPWFGDGRSEKLQETIAFRRTKD